MLDTSAWFAGKALGEDWASSNYEHWADLLEPLIARPARLLEIGCWEGRSALFWLNYLPLSTLVCVDPWNAGDPYMGWADMREVERKFDANVAPFGDRVRKVKSNSHAALIDMGVRRERFDSIYIDGHHGAPYAYGDGVLAWPLLEPGGTLIFDDYEYQQGGDIPKDGIEPFLETHAGQYELLRKDWQIAVRKA